MGEPAPSAAAHVQATGQPVSDWPVALLLDELWLRSRRELVHGLERAGLWADGECYQRVMSEQVMRGRQLEADLLLAGFPVDERYLWQSDVPFGPQRQHLERKTPAVLAFGKAMVEFIAAVIQPSRTEATAQDHFDREACEPNRFALAGALFNLGISLVDLLVDHRPEYATAMTEWLDGDRLLSLSAGDLSPHADALDHLPLDETRLVLRVVLEFFDTVRAGPLWPERDGEELTRLLLRAYAAELASTSGASGTAGGIELFRAGVAKSALPFFVLGWLAERTAELSSPGAATEIAGLLGESFSIVDDLVDLIEDLRAGSVNRLLTSTPMSIEQSPVPYRDIASLVSGDLITAEVQVLVARLTALRDLTVEALGGTDAMTPMLCYIRNWLE
jgi:hypothetical protein